MIVGSPDHDGSGNEEESGTLYLVLDSELAVNDGDGDGFLDALDCAPLDDQTWAQPTEVQDLTVSHNQMTNITTLSWSPPVNLGSTSVVYDAMYSTDASDFLSATCIAVDTVDTFAVDATAPPPGTVRNYLARAENNCGLGSTGETGGALRQTVDCPR